MTWAQKNQIQTVRKKTIFLRGEDFQWRSQNSLWAGASIYIYKSECLSVYCQLETTVLILLGSNWVQWIQNFVENDLGTKKIRFRHFGKKPIFWGVRIFNGEAKTHSGMGPLSIYMFFSKVAPSWLKNALMSCCHCQFSVNVFVTIVLIYYLGDPWYYTRAKPGNPASISINLFLLVSGSLGA